MADLDILVVGGGFAGLMAALAAARGGSRVRLVSRGQGALGIGGGTIDVLGYAPGRTAALRDPFAGFAALEATHPYRLAGTDRVTAALRLFLEVCAAGGYPYLLDGTPEAPCNRRLLTSIGTMKPACLVPASMGMEGVAGAAEVLVAGIEGLKDFYPRLAAQGLARLLPGRMTPVTLGCPAALAPLRGTDGACARLRDLSSLDVARFLDAPAGRVWLADRLRREPAWERLRERGGAVLLPPVLGSTPAACLEARAALSGALGCPVFELVSPPPSVTGLRLHALLMAELRRLGVEVTLNAEALRPELATGPDGLPRVAAMEIAGAGRVRRVAASAFILATGGVYGDGIEARPNAVRDRIFETVRLTPALTPLDADWSVPEAYPAPGRGHAFARLGARVDARFRPADETGAALFANVFYAGRAVGGYDPAAEKSGNGVALVSACAAAAGACDWIHRGRA